MLEQFVEDDPSDPFNHYALALELVKVDKNQAKRIFDRLMVEHRTYIATYYQAAILYLEAALIDEATKIIEQGIGEARKQNNPKAVSELKSLLDEIE
jgi:hypothetical protein